MLLSIAAQNALQPTRARSHQQLRECAVVPHEIPQRARRICARLRICVHEQRRDERNRAPEQVVAVRRIKCRVAQLRARGCRPTLWQYGAGRRWCALACACALQRPHRKARKLADARQRIRAPRGYVEEEIAAVRRVLELRWRQQAPRSVLPRAHTNQVHAAQSGGGAPVSTMSAAAGS
jgi:hypothetical protein